MDFVYFLLVIFGIYLIVAAINAVIGVYHRKIENKVIEEVLGEVNIEQISKDISSMSKISLPSKRMNKFITFIELYNNVRKEYNIGKLCPSCDNFL